MATGGWICLCPGYVHYDLAHEPTADRWHGGVRVLPVARRAGDVRPARD